MLGYVPIKSCRLAPGRFRDTTTADWIVRSVTLILRTPPELHQPAQPVLNSEEGNMNCVLETQGDHSFAIVNRDDARSVVGFVHPRAGRYGVDKGWFGSAMSEGSEIAVVNSPDDVIPALAAYLERNPPQWKHEGGTRYSKFTPSGTLWVDRDR
jgi:hypothetical protein